MELECRLGSLETAPHVIMISEVKPKYYRRTLTPTECKLDQYEMIHKNLEYREVNINSIFEEFLAVEIKLNNKNKKMLIINVYRSGSCKEANNDCLNQLLVNIGLNRDYEQVMICGDMNFRDINCEDLSDNGSVEFKFIEATRDAYMKQHIDKPTRGRGSVSLSLLDLIITRDDSDVKDIKIESLLGKVTTLLYHVDYYVTMWTSPEPRQCSNMIKRITMRWKGWWT